jgi:hypothetical protein
MRSSRTLRRVGLAILISVGFLIQGTWALAATTGGLAGNVHDDTGAPVAGATVTASSPSQTATTTTDAQGHFVFLVLAPDTYTLTIKKNGYQTVSIAGNTVFADQVQQVVLTQPRALQVIAHAHTTASALVKSGVGSDIYNVSSSQIAAAAPLGGGAQLNTAYSAIASVPGVVEMNGGAGAGWDFSGVYIRGQQSFFTSYEYDGIPVNRAFDNYNGSVESSLGLQELQVYTGGGPASNSSAGTSGFINEVIKTGTYPGYATLTGGIATGAFYHAVKLEAGGSTPDRNFSYYVGLSGNDQALRYINAQDGGNLMTPGQAYAGYGYAGMFGGLVGTGTGTVAFSSDGYGDRSICGLNTLTPIAPSPADAVNGAGAAGCWNFYLGSYGQATYISDREDVVNLHFGIPRRDGQRDDIQLLWSGSAMSTQGGGSVSDAGGYGPYTLDETLFPYAAPTCAPSAIAPQGICSGNYPSWVDAFVYNLPFGAPVAGVKPQWYYQPDSPRDRPAFGQLPLNLRENMSNDMEAVKLQWTHPFSDNAFMRVFAYSMYSDWMMAGFDTAWGGYVTCLGPCGSIDAADYELPTHTGGGEIDLVDQINDQNLVQLTGNYVSATTTRWNNTGFIGASPLVGGNGSPIGYIAKVGSGYDCYDYTTGAQVPCGSTALYTSGSQTYYTSGPPGNAPCAGGAHCYWGSLWNGNANGEDNTVSPKFYFLSLTDEFRPNDRLVIDGGIRYDHYTYDLANSNTPWTNFYANIVAQDLCVNNVGTVYSAPLPPGQPPPAPPIYTLTCPPGYQHPPFTGASPSSYNLADWSARGSLTYTAGPNTVFRLSAGRYTEPPISASVQYLALSGNSESVWAATLPLGFDSPFHPIPPMSSSQYDLSWEQHIPNTDISFKISPFYTHIAGYQEQSFIGSGFVTQVPVGQFRSYGVEGALSIGDFASNGLAAQASLTYTNARVQYQTYFGANQIVSTNSAIAAFNALTKAGGGYPCYASNDQLAYTGANPTIGGACGSANATNGGAINDVVNPYYNMAEQGYLNPNGWYEPADTGLSPTSNPHTSYFDSPWVGDIILNWRANKLAITPSVQLIEGSPYGGPMDIIGLDPRTCGYTQGETGVPGGVAGNCDWTTVTAPAASSAAGVLYIPNPQTGQFATPGEYRNPSLITGNLGITYDVSPRLRLALTATNIFHTCFGGSKEPWTTSYPPGANVCGYFVNSGYVSNFYNGTGPSDATANGNTPYPWQLASYGPGTGSDTTDIPMPFNIYLEAEVHL